MRHWDILARQSCVKQDKAAKDKLHKQLQTWLLLIMLSFYFYYHFLSKKTPFPWLYASGGAPVWLGGSMHLVAESNVWMF